MTIPVWPSINFLHELGSWKLTPSTGSGRISTQMDNGATRDRRRFTQKESKCEFNLHLTSAEFQRFKSFYDNELFDGTRWFIMPIYEGSNYKSHIVKFDGSTAPSAANAGYNSVSVPIALTVRNLFVVSSGTIYLFDTYGGDLSMKMFEAIDKFVNKTYPAFSERLPTQ